VGGITGVIGGGVGTVAARSAVKDLQPMSTQLIVDDKSLNEVDYGQAVKTAAVL